MKRRFMPIPPSMICHCLRCGHSWVKRIEGRPITCPKCKEHHWDIPVGKLKMGRPPKNMAGKLKRGETMSEARLKKKANS